MKEVDVVVGIILNENKFLVERRRSDEEVDPGIVCLPGGHARANECMDDALKREMREELDIEVKDSKFVCKNLYVASNGERQNAYCFLITDYEGKPICKSAQEIFWEDNIRNLSLEVDRQTLTRLRAPANPLLNQFHLQKTLTTMLDKAMPTVAQIEYRLVGTAAALLYGVQLPAADIDLLLKEREAVDVFSSALSSFKCLTSPTLLLETKQYYTAYEINGVEVAASTVEWETDSDGIECFGRGPWEHFVLIPCGPYSVPTVALELRLVSELTRNRPERYIPIIQYMKAYGCNTDLLRRGMDARALPQARRRDVLAQLKEPFT